MYFGAVKDRDFQFLKGSGEFEKTTDLEPDLILLYRKADIIMSGNSAGHYKIIIEILLKFVDLAKLESQRSKFKCDEMAEYISER